MKTSDYNKEKLTRGDVIEIIKDSLNHMDNESLEQLFNDFCVADISFIDYNIENKCFDAYTYKGTKNGFKN